MDDDDGGNASNAEATADVCAQMASQHTAMMDEHAELANQILDCTKMFTNADDFDDLSKRIAPLPEGFSVITPNDPNVKRIPRFGQPAVRSNVDPIFDCIFGEGA